MRYPVVLLINGLATLQKVAEHGAHSGLAHSFLYLKYTRTTSVFKSHAIEVFVLIIPVKSMKVRFAKSE